MEVILDKALAVKAQPFIDTAVEQRFASQLFAQDATLWGPEAEAESRVRLGWVVDPTRWSGLIAEVTTLRDALRESGVTTVILCGMGGSSLAPEVMAKHDRVRLYIVDSTHPNQLAPLVTGDLSSSVVVVSSKSGGTLETDSQRRIFEQAFRSQGIDPQSRIIVVTDPQSPLHVESQKSGFRVFLGDATIGGRFSALSPFGLVPAVLAGVNVAEIVEHASAIHGTLSLDSPENPGLVLGAGMAAGFPATDKILLQPLPGLPGFGDWIEQLVAESTGKQGVGLLPVVESALTHIPDGVTVGATAEAEIVLRASLGEQLLLWEVATAFACRILGVNPFDQPNVESAKIAAKALLDEPARTPREETMVEGFTVWSSLPLSPEVNTLAQLVHQWRSLFEEHSYGAVCVFGNQALWGPWNQAVLALEESLNRPITLGFGPRFLHSTGQLHKGGTSEGVFLQVIQTPDSVIDIPGRDFDLGTLMLAQAHGDAQVLADAGVPVISVTATTEQLPALWEALEA